MWAASNLPPNRWDKFILTTTYLQMCIATKSLNNITPFEAYHGHRPDISHLREIGCRAFVLILNKHNPKIFQCSEEHVMIGYRKNSKTYRCYHRGTHKVIKSYHVRFIESKDKCEVPFRPGVTQGLDDESIDPQDTVPIAPNQPSLNPTPNPNLGILTAPPIQTASPTASTSTIPPVPPTSTLSHIQRSS